jgi:hypothetical protein
MGYITSSTTDINGKHTETKVRTNWLEDLVINTLGRLFGDKVEWRMVHFVEKRKLRRAAK